MNRGAYLFGVALTLFFVPILLHATDFVEFSFTAEIYSIDDRESAAGIAERGDVIYGVLVYDPATESLRSESTTDRDFTLSVDDSEFEVLLNGHRFAKAPNKGGYPADNDWIRMSLSSHGRDEDGGVVYSRHIRANSDVSSVWPGFSVESANLSLWLGNNSSETQMDVEHLPTAIDFTSFETAQFNLTLHMRTGEYTRLAANITTFHVSSGARSQVRGRVYADADQDCEFNNDDLALKRQFVSFYPGDRLTTTNENGEYQILLPKGEYTASVLTGELWDKTCPDGSAATAVDVGPDPVTLDIGVEPRILAERADVSLVSGMARPGFDMRYWVRVRNTGTLPCNADLRFVYDAILTNFRSMPEADELNTNEAVWRVQNLLPTEELDFDITLGVPPDEALLGRTICAQAQVDKLDDPGDDILGGSVDELCQQIRGSFDPNDMRVFVDTRNADGVILPTDRVLRYVIRFQNEGNEDAINVRVVDQLSQFHNIGRLRIGASSHDFEFNLTADNALEWTFNNINLPPKSEDEIASQGFVRFNVELFEDLPQGTDIPNQAAIYFDFNSPVLTNTVVSHIGRTTTDVEHGDDAADMHVFPNPATETLNIDLGDKQEGKQSATFSIRNMLGQELLRGELNNQHSTINVAALTTGMYFLTIRNRNGAQTLPLNIAR